MMETSRRKGLGRGLSALIPQAPAPAAPADRSLAIDDIAPNPFQPRAHFDESALAEMVESIREQGVVQPLLVRRADRGYELVAGERRLRAARLAGLDAVPVVVRDLDDRQTLEIALVENLQREDLSALEEAAAYARLAEEFDLTQDEIAARVGKSRPAVANTMRLLGLPEPVREDLRRGAITAGHARALLAVPSSAEQISLARETVRKAWSVRQLENRIRLRGRMKPRKGSTPNLHVADVETQLSRSLGTRVRLQGGAKRGRIVVEYYSPEELERLITRFRDGKHL